MSATSGGEESPTTRLTRQREEASRRLDAWRSELRTAARDLDDRAARIGDAGTATAEPPPRMRARGPRSALAAIRTLPAWPAIGLAASAAYVWLALAAGGVERESFAAAAVVVWWTVLVAAVVGAWPSGHLSRPTAVAAVLLAGFAGLALVSAEWASDNGRAFAEGVRALGYLGLFCLTAIVSRAGGARALLSGLAVGLVAVAALALLSRLQPWTTGVEAELESILPGSAGRLSYPIGYWNGLAACMALALCLLAWLGADARSRAARALALAAFPLPVLAIWLTASRGGLLAAACGVAVVVAFTRLRWRALAVVLIGLAGAVPLVALAHAEPDLVRGIDTPIAESAGDRVTLLAIGIALVLAAVAYVGDGVLTRLHPSRLGLPARPTAVAVVVLIVIAGLAVNPGQRLRESRALPPAGTQAEPVEGEVATGVVSGRAEYWDAALDAFGERPVLGIGAGEFESWWLQNGELSQAVSNAHSLYIESLAELGLAGFVCVVGFLAVAFVAGARRARTERRSADRGDAGVLAAALALLLAGAVAALVEWTWELPAAFAPVIVAAAILTTPAAPRDSGAAAGGRRRRFAVRGLALAASLVAVGASGAVFLGELRLRDSQQAAAEGDLAAAAEDARAASDLQPWAADPYTQLALVESGRGRLVPAREAITAAIKRAPEDWSLWLVAAQIEDRLGDPDAAQGASDRARELAPRAPESVFRGLGDRGRGGS